MVTRNTVPQVEPGNPELEGIDAAYWDRRKTRARNAGLYLAGILDAHALGNIVEIKRALNDIDGYASIVPTAADDIAAAIEAATMVRPFVPHEETAISYPISVGDLGELREAE